MQSCNMSVKRSIKIDGMNKFETFKIAVFIVVWAESKLRQALSTQSVHVRALLPQYLGTTVQSCTQSLQCYIMHILQELARAGCILASYKHAFAWARGKEGRDSLRKPLTSA